MVRFHFNPNHQKNEPYTPKSAQHECLSKSKRYDEMMPGLPVAQVGGFLALEATRDPTLGSLTTWNKLPRLNKTAEEEKHSCILDDKPYLGT